MKNLILGWLIVNTAFATVSTELINKKTSEKFILSCSAESFDECPMLTVSDENKELTKISYKTLEAIANNFKKHRKNDRPEVLPYEHNPFQQESTDLPGYFFNTSEILWSLATYHNSSMGPAHFIAGALTPITAGIDIAALVTIDGAYIISYPIRALVKAIAGQNHLNFRAARALKKLKNGKKIRVSNTTFGEVKTNFLFWAPYLAKEIMEELIFTSDHRPVDGALKEITLNKVEDGYSINIRTVNFDRTTGSTEDTTDGFPYLECTITKSSNNIEEINCSDDSRPSDGSLVEINIKKNADQAYEATLHENFYNRIEQRTIDKLEVIASDLILDF